MAAHNDIARYLDWLMSGASDEPDWDCSSCGAEPCPACLAGIEHREHLCVCCVLFALETLQAEAVVMGPLPLQ